MADMNITVGLDDRASRKLREIDRAANALSGTLRTAGAAAAAFATGSIATGIVNQYRSFEKYRTVLTTFLGSQKKANAELARLQVLANSLPQDLQDVTEAFTILGRNGIDTGSEALTNFSNIATANGKSLTQLGEAVADALTGEFERLKEFGIKVSKENNKFVARIGNDQVALAGTTTDLVNQLEQLGATRFGGAAAANADTLNQSFSNLSGSVFQTSITIGEELKPALKDVVDLTATWLSDNQELAKMIGSGLGASISTVASGVRLLADNFALVRDLLVGGLIIKGATAFLYLAKALQPASGSAATLNTVLSKTFPLISRAGTAIFNFAKNLVGLKNIRFAALLLNPWTAIPTAIAAAGYALWRFQDATIQVGNTTSTLGEVATASFNIISRNAVALWETFKTSAVNGINNAITAVDAFAQANGIYDFVSSALGYLQTFYVNVYAGIGAVVQFMVRNWGIIGDVVGSVISNIADNWDNITTFISENVKLIAQIIYQFGQSAITIFKAAIETISGWWTWLVDNVRDAMVAIGDRVKRILNFVINTFVVSFETIKAIILNLPSFFVEAARGIGKVVSDLGSALTSKFSNIGEALGMALSGDFSGAMAKAGEEVGFSFKDSFQNAMADVSIIPAGAVNASAIYAEDRLGQAAETIGTYFGSLGDNVKNSLSESGQSALSAIDNAISGATGGDFALTRLRDEFKASFEQIATDFENNKNSINGSLENFNLERIREIGSNLANILPPEAAAALESEIMKMQQIAEQSKYYDDAILRASRTQDGLTDAVAGTNSELDNLSDKKLPIVTEKVKTFAEQLGDAITGLSSSISGTLTDVFLGLQDGFQGMKDIALSVVKTIVNSLVQNFLVAPLLNNISTALQAAFAPKMGGGGGGLLSIFGKAIGLPFFDGGGYTGVGARAGGIDGKGGFPAVLHPNESIVDHSKGQSIGGNGGDAPVININIQAIDTQTGAEFLVKNKQIIVGAVQEAYNRKGRAGPLG